MSAQYEHFFLPSSTKQAYENVTGHPLSLSLSLSLSLYLSLSLSLSLLSCFLYLNLFGPQSHSLSGRPQCTFFMICHCPLNLISQIRATPPLCVGTPGCAQCSMTRSFIKCQDTCLHSATQLSVCPPPPTYIAFINDGCHIRHAGKFLEREGERGPQKEIGNGRKWTRDGANQCGT